MVVKFRKQMLRAVRRRGGAVVVSGEPGSGRTRKPDAFVLEAKLLGAAVLRAGAHEGAT